MKILVTGGCGFIGHHIVNQLVKDNHDVIVIDDCSADNDKFYFNDRATYYKHSICNYDTIESLFEGVEYVFHLAAESRIQSAIDNPMHAVNVNVVGTTNILMACKKYNIKRIIYSGTSSVYGLTNCFPTKENNEIDCLNPYASTKYCGEEMIRCFTKLYGVDSCIFRYFNVYGEDSPVTGPYSLVIGIFLNQKKNNEPITLVGDGESLRDFVYVKDVVDINIKAMEHKENLNGEIFNVGSGTNYKIKDIARSISSDIIEIPKRLGEAKTTLADIEKAKNILNWHPSMDLLDWLKINS
jgi:UDP-glucose 4-epimerase